jgi:hypothetical protein
VTVVSTAFAPLAQVVAEGIGQPCLPLVIVPHPVGDRDQALVRRRGGEIAALCVKVLTTPVAELEREFKHKQYPLPKAVMPR